MNVLVVHPTPRPFINLDIDLLRTSFDVRAVHIHFAPRLQFAADTFTALRGVLWADVVIAWFGGLHALLPFFMARLVGTRCAVVASGVDVAAVPAINYGHMRGGMLRWVGRLVFLLAHRVFAVSEHTAREAKRNALVPPEKLQVIHHGVPNASTSTGPDGDGRSGVTTVARADTQTVLRKGLETFLQAACQLPEIPFQLIGGGTPDILNTLRQSAPPNVTFLGWQDPESLLQHLKRTRVYVQLSAYESFGMALAEAMACGCLPVVTERGALPEVVGPAGWYVPYGDAEATAAGIRKALAAPPSAAEQARERIRKHFPLDRRRRALVAAVRALCPAISSSP